MNKEDRIYMCQMVANLTGLPVRYTVGDKMIFQFSPVSFERDPMELHMQELQRITDSIGYYMTSEFLYYGFIKQQNELFLIGPTSEVPLSQSLIKKMGFELGLTGNDLTGFEHSMQSLACMPITSTLQILCAINFGFYGEKRTIKDVAILQETQSEIATETIRSQTKSKEFTDPSELSHNTYAAEQAILGLIREGSLQELLEWIERAPSLRPGVMAPNQLRQMKNTFIVTATLATRAAIEGGLSVDEAFSLSDLYIKKCETLDTPDRIMNLQYHMILDITSQVQQLRFGGAPSPLVLQVTKYVRIHISEHISTEDVAGALFLSRGYLSTSFKKETGISLSDYIMSVKIEEAKRLLYATDKTMAEISSFLGFSSQSHFTNCFQKFAGMKPSEYRKKQVK